MRRSGEGYRQFCGARRYFTVDECGRVLGFHVATLDVVAAHVRHFGWFAMRRLVLVQSVVDAEVPALLAVARGFELSVRRERFNPSLFTGEWDITYFGDPLEAPSRWIDIAVVFRSGGNVMFTVETQEDVAAELADPDRTPTDGYYADLLVVERIDPLLIREAVSSIVSAGLLRCGVWTVPDAAADSERAS